MTALPSTEDLAATRNRLAELRDIVTDERLHDSGRYFADCFDDLTRCDHGDTGEYGNRHDGEAIALLWNLWQSGGLPALLREVLDRREAEGWRDISTAPPTDEYSPLMLLWVPHDLGGYIFVGTRNVAGNWIDNLVMDEHQPTHWRPLPSTPTTEASHGE